MYNLSKCIEKISIVEMKHMEILAKVLINSNIDPKYCTFIDNNPEICNYWSAGSVNYCTNLKEFLKSNIELENMAIRDYNRLLNITHNENLKEIVKRILLDEYDHVKFFRYALDTVQ